MVSVAQQVKQAKLRGVPLVAIETPDPEATIVAILDLLDRGSYGESLEAPPAKVAWDLIRGLVPRNSEGKKLVAALGDDTTVQNPNELLIKAAGFPAKSLVFVMNAHRFLTDPTFIQGVWNLRDEFKSDRRMIVLLAPNFQFPAELAGDVVIFDEPLPTEAEIGVVLREVHDTLGVAVPEDLGPATEAVLGVTKFQAEQLGALSITENGLDLENLWDRKRKQIEQTPGLKVWKGGEKFAEIGGVSVIKNFIARVLNGNAKPNAILFLDELEKSLGGAKGDTSGVGQDQLGALLSYMQDQNAVGMIFVGPPGCLSGDTELSYRRGNRNSGRRMKLKTLYQKFNSLPVDGGRGEVTPWHKPCDTFLHSYNHATGVVQYNRILAVTSSGVKECIELIVSSGERLRLTADHLVLTPEGFVEAGQLQVGVEVVVRGSMIPSQSPQRAPRSERVSFSGLRFYSSGSEQSVRDPGSGKVYRYRRQTRARLVVEANMNNMSLETYIYQLKNDQTALKLKVLADDVDVHHKNGNSVDDRLENLEILSRAAHPLEHDPLSRFNVEYTCIATVIDVRPCGPRETFDIEMEAPLSNFATADGLIVHNCAKSVIAKAAGNEAGIPTIQLDLGAAKGSLVGQSEQQLRTALKVITAVSNGRSLWIATCNSIGELPPELRRRFNLGTFFFDLPDAEERAAIWKIYRAKYNLGDDVVDDTDWTGAEIRQCADIAWRLSCSLTEAASFVVPVARAAAESIERLRKLADGRFLSASKPGVYHRDELKAAGKDSGKDTEKEFSKPRALKRDMTLK